MRRNFADPRVWKERSFPERTYAFLTGTGWGAGSFEGAMFAVDEQQKIEHQIELATRAASLVKDETTVDRFRSFAEEMSRKLLRMMRRGKVRARAYELWEQAGRPADRDLDFWLEAERQIEDEHDGQRRPDGPER